MRRTPLKAGRRKRRESMAPFWEAVAMGRACVFAGRDAGYPCEGPVEAHHILMKQHLRPEDQGDPRNGVPVCRRHHPHLHARSLFLDAQDIPEGFEEFWLGYRHLAPVGLPRGADPSFRRAA